MVSFNLQQDIRSLTDFKRRTVEMVEHMKQTGRPVVLTVNGRAELVVQDAEGYQRMLDAIEEAETVAGIRKGIESMERGEGQPFRRAFAAIRRKHRIPTKT